MLLKQALQETNSQASGTTRQLDAVPSPAIATSGPTDKHGKRSKKAKAKSMIEIPGAGLRSKSNWKLPRSNGWTQR